MKKLFILSLLSLSVPGLARGSDDNILISNLYDESDENYYWNVSSSEKQQIFFNSISRDLAIAISHKNTAPGETLGWNGFEVGLDTTIAFIPLGGEQPLADQDSPCHYLEDGVDPGACAWRIMDADHRLTFGNALMIPTLRLRKGLPFSTEVGLDLSYIAFSHQTAVSGYGRLAFHEGMWDKTWRVIPDVAFTVAGTRFLGNEELELSEIEWNATLGWTFPVGGVRDSYVGAFSPFIGFGVMYITSVPRDPLPGELSGLDGVTGLALNEVLDPDEGEREVALDPALSPWKCNVGFRVASGMFRFVSVLEFTRNTEQSRFDRPSVTVGAGFVY